MNNTKTETNTNLNSTIPNSGGEVVGANGRIGSFLFRQGAGTLSVIPRGVQPGSKSPPSTPIYVAINAAGIPKLIEDTVEERRCDLVLVVNGIHRDIINEWRDTYQHSENDVPLQLTTVVPHFGVLSVGGDVVTSPYSPSTIAHGPHAKDLEKLLGSNINFATADTEDEMHAAATKKLLWASFLWLLCHNDGPDKPPIDVGTVHDRKSDLLRKLVDEVLPAANFIAFGQETINESTPDKRMKKCIGSTDEIMNYLEQYSRSLSTAIVKLSLSIKEITARNGVFLSVCDDFPQPLHCQLVRQVAGEDSLERCITLAGSRNGLNE